MSEMNNLTKNFDELKIMNEITDMRQAIDFGGINYYTPDGVAEIPCAIDNALAGMISATNQYLDKLPVNGKNDEYRLKANYNDMDTALHLIISNLSITVISLYRRFIYDINSILPSNARIGEDNYVISSGIKGSIGFLINEYTDRIKKMDMNEINDSLDWNVVMLNSCIAYMNNIAVGIYNSSYDDFSRAIYMNNNFDKEFIAHAFSEYIHYYTMFMYDLMAEVNPFYHRAMEGVNLIMPMVKAIDSHVYDDDDDLI